MNNEERQALLDNISPEDLAKIESHKGLDVKVEPEDLLLAEFAIKFGWQAYKEAKADEITGIEMMRLIAASRKLDHLGVLRGAQASLIGNATVRSKTPSQTFKKLTAKIVKMIEADK